MSGFSEGGKPRRNLTRWGRHGSEAAGKTACRHWCVAVRVQGPRLHAPPIHTASSRRVLSQSHHACLHSDLGRSFHASICGSAYHSILESGSGWVDSFMRACGLDDIYRWFGRLGTGMTNGLQGLGTNRSHIGSMAQLVIFYFY